MKKEAGLWIDHRGAVIIIIDEKGEEIIKIASDLEKHIRFSGGAQKDSEEDIRDNRFINHLNKYYDEVIACIRNATSILVFGPGEAKIEFKNRLEREKIKNLQVIIDTDDKMTDHEIKAKVIQYFKNK